MSTVASDWRKLTEFLRAAGQDRVVLTLDAVEEIVGPPLLNTARVHRSFWVNARKRYSRAWLDAGYVVTLAGLPPDQMAFERDPTLSAGLSARSEIPAQATAGGAPPAPPSDIAAILVGCVATKVSHPAPARELYASELLRGRQRCAERSGKPWVILSARHGVVDPDTVLAPYEQRAADLK